MPDRLDLEEGLTPLTRVKTFFETDPHPLRPPHEEDGGGSKISPAVTTDTPPSPCLGCGFCCSKAPCAYSMGKYSVAHPCPALLWNVDRYICANAEDPVLRHAVGINAGCCSSMNTWRGSKIERRPEIENPLPHHRRVVSGHDL